MRIEILAINGFFPDIEAKRIFPIPIWSYGIVIDTKDVFFYGFPMIYKSEGFHTSLSTQYFIFELSVNILTYFLISLIITLLINRVWTIKISNRIAKIFWIGFALFFSGAIFLSNELNDMYKIKRDFEVEILDSGISILEQTPNRENYLEEVNEWIKQDKKTHRNIGCAPGGHLSSVGH